MLSSVHALCWRTTLPSSAPTATPKPLSLALWRLHPAPGHPRNQDRGVSPHVPTHPEQHGRHLCHFRRSGWGGQSVWAALESSMARP